MEQNRDPQRGHLKSLYEISVCGLFEMLLSNLVKNLQMKPMRLFLKISHDKEI